MLDLQQNKIINKLSLYFANEILNSNSSTLQSYMKNEYSIDTTFLKNKGDCEIARV